MNKELKQVINQSYEPILPSVHPYKGVRSNLPTAVMDDQTYELIQIDDLYEAVNFTRTFTGAAVLDRSLQQPLTNAALITEKQHSLEELRSDYQLRDKIRDFVDRVAKDEKALYSLYNDDYSAGFMNVGMSIYNAYKDSMRFFKRMMGGVAGTRPQTPYLEALLQNFDDLKEDKVSDFIKGPVQRGVFRGIKHKKDLHFPGPVLDFKATDWRLIRSAIMLAPLAESFNMVLSKDPLLYQYGIMLEIIGVMWILISRDLARGFDNRVFVRPLANIYFNNPSVLNALESFGKLDELLSLADYADYLRVPVTLPEVTDSPSHYFEAKDLRNPVLAKKNPDYVGNDVDLNGARVTFLTGPNSGGKTSLSKTILQAQVLAQIGSYIPASEARVAVADGIYYHSPMINSLQDDEGRFGVEIQRTRDIFYKITPRSIVVLDELIEATTYEEKIKHSKVILDGFWELGGNTILVTHNHELAEDFKQRGRGQFWQVEFNRDHPTHRIKPGISTDSHTEEVLKRVGFTREDIKQHLNSLGIFPLSSNPWG